MWADAVPRDGRLDLLDIVTKCGREDSLWLLEVGRPSRYKMPARPSTGDRRQGREQGSGAAVANMPWEKPVECILCTRLFCSLGPETPPLRSGADRRPGLGGCPRDGPAGLRASGSNFAPAPPPRGTANGRGRRAAGAQVGTGAVSELPKTPLGLLGLVVVAGGSRTARYWLHTLVIPEFVPHARSPWNADGV